MPRTDRPKTFRLAAHLIATLATLILTMPSAAADAAKPNIVYILADDLGYGDVSALNARSKIRTPNLDRLAAEGMRFTDAHSGSAVCSPTRYGILTGRYAWRTHLRSGVLWGYSKPLIAPDRLTVGRLLQQQGYATACFGKWHLGMDWPLTNPPPGPRALDAVGAAPKVDFARPILHGPTTVGFDHYFGISASLDMPPYCWIEDDRTVGIPSETRSLWKNRAGAAAPGFEATDVLPTLARKAAEYVDQRAREAKRFFAYVPLNAPHTPIEPSQDFAGKSGIGTYGDFVIETDWAVGQILDALDRNRFADNTLVIFTSDNGCSPEANFPELAAHGHNPNYVFRGNKADIFEGGHHIPFLARWPGKVKPGSACADTTCLTDLIATAADLLHVRLPDDAAEDSASILPDLLGTAAGPAREATVHQSINGSLAIRQGQWKLEICPDSGGWSAPKPQTPAAKGLPAVQLYDMSQDIGELTNQQAEHPEIVAKLRDLLQQYIDRGRSTPGASQANDVRVTILPPWMAKKPEGD